MISKSLVLLASVALSLASPVHNRRAKAGCAEPVLPFNGNPVNDHELSTPPDGSKIKHIVLGLGIQNYTCASIGADPAATGALAMLYDVTDLYPGRSDKSLSQDTFNALTGTALWTHDVPLNFNESTANRVDPSSPGASLTDPFTADAPLELDGLDPLPFAGHHFFNSAGVPTFVLDGGAINYLGRKDDGIKAPTNADPGPQGTGAVDWLQLGPAAGTVGAVELYRVLTAGGVSHGCSTAAGDDTTTYAALYWFYE